MFERFRNAIGYKKDGTPDRRFKLSKDNESKDSTINLLLEKMMTRYRRR
jgi:hypothetical protein